MTESIFYITLTENPFVLDGKRKNGAELNLRENRSIAFICVIFDLLLVAEDQNATFSSVGVSILVLDGH